MVNLLAWMPLIKNRNKGVRFRLTNSWLMQWIHFRNKNVLNKCSNFSYLYLCLSIKVLNKILLGAIEKYKYRPIVTILYKTIHWRRILYPFYEFKFSDVMIGILKHEYYCMYWTWTLSWFTFQFRSLIEEWMPVQKILLNVS